MDDFREDLVMTLEELFKSDADWDAAINLKRCRTCIHRKRYELNEFSNKVVQCCEMRPSSRSNSGYRTIRTTDIACQWYKEGGKE